MKLYCQKPVIIQVSNLMSLLWKYSIISTPYGDIDLDYNILSNLQFSATKDGYLYMYSPKRMNVKVDTVDQYNLVDKDTGCSIPMFMLVPCGKCALCKEKKLNQWKTRTFLECQTHDFLPHFITLTYKPALTPYDGLHKEDLQLFMKRLREHISRKFPDCPPLRFIACGEYGHNSHLPHYHLLIWNLPKFETFTDLVHFIEERWNYGFVYVKPCQDSLHGSYICKYMRKDCEIPTFTDATGNKKKCKPVFWLSSRGNGGLGIDWLRINKIYYQDPSNIQIIEKDKFTNKVHTFGLPDYFRDKLFPTVSRILPKEVRDNFATFLTDFRALYWSRMLKFKCSKDVYITDLLDMLNDVLPKFNFIDTDFKTQILSASEIPQDILRIKDKVHMVFDYSVFLERFYFNYAYLKGVEIDSNMISKYLHLKALHMEKLEDLLSLRPDIDVTAELYKINERIAKQNSKDFY